jgi:nucleotide-binding universal stress UspA family protein
MRIYKEDWLSGVMTTEIIAGRENGVAEMRSKAQAAKVDLIIVGGRNTFSSLLVGSVTEELLTIWKYHGL